MKFNKEKKLLKISPYDHFCPHNNFSFQSKTVNLFQNIGNIKIERHCLHWYDLDEAYNNNERPDTLSSISFAISAVGACQSRMLTRKYYDKCYLMFGHLSAVSSGYINTKTITLSKSPVDIECQLISLVSEKWTVFKFKIADFPKICL